MIARAFTCAATERGSALLCALLVTALVTALGGAVVLIVTTETMISGNFRSAQRVRYAAETGIERAIGVLRGQSDWPSIPGMGDPGADLDDGVRSVLLLDGTWLDLNGLTAEQQRRTDAVFGALPDRPVWRLFVHARCDRLLPIESGPNPEYIVVWVADDPDELDGDPLHDANDAVMLHAEAFGIHGGRWPIDAMVRQERLANERDANGVPSRGIRVLSWREGP